MPHFPLAATKSNFGSWKQERQTKALCRLNVHNEFCRDSDDAKGGSMWALSHWRLKLVERFVQCYFYVLAMDSGLLLGMYNETPCPNAYLNE